MDHAQIIVLMDGTLMGYCANVVISHVFTVKHSTTAQSVGLITFRITSSTLLTISVDQYALIGSILIIKIRIFYFVGIVQLAVFSAQIILTVLCVLKISLSGPLTISTCAFYLRIVEIISTLILPKINAHLVNPIAENVLLVQSSHLLPLFPQDFEDVDEEEKFKRFAVQLMPACSPFLNRVDKFA